MLGTPAVNHVAIVARNSAANWLHLLDDVAILVTFCVPEPPQVTALVR